MCSSVWLFPRRCQASGDRNHTISISCRCALLTLCFLSVRLFVTHPQQYRWRVTNRDLAFRAKPLAQGPCSLFCFLYSSFCFRTKYRCLFSLQKYCSSGIPWEKGQKFSSNEPYLNIWWAMLLLHYYYYNTWQLRKVCSVCGIDRKKKL